MSITIRANLLFPKLPQNTHKSQFSFPSSISHQTIIPQKLSCAKKPTNTELASELATQISKIKTQTAEKQEAMKKSRALLFTEICEFSGVENEEMKSQWRKKMGEDEKWGLVKSFVLEWGSDFQPLSAKSVKEMVDEYLAEEEDGDSQSSLFFSGWKRMIGF